MNSAGASNSNTPNPMPPTRESTPSSSTPKAINIGKFDPAWAHCKEVSSANGRKGLLCLYCSKVLSGNGINRFKQHLVGLKGNAGACRKVPDAVRFRMQEHLKAIDVIASMGAGYKGLGFHDLWGYLLTKNVEEVRKYVDSYRPIWKEMDCTIMADGWTDQCRRTLINFLVYCPKGIVFLKSVDASDASKTGEMLYKLFREVVLFVGQENVVHFVTDNAANYVAVGHLLEQEFRTIFWSPCAAHCINLILGDIGKLDKVNDIVTHAAKIT
ncbi:uncharacterized protein LOC116193697 [Punica granatum]|uniref:Uncharacterized protein LOC116193697 n=1 Tax=Punica granatum TaxID=22663 RepID=A0A6P8C695_PUNGR|nr:uncharacterized protein LOC116193697 [Punica granatum]